MSCTALNSGNCGVTGGSSSLIIVFGWTLFISLFYILGSVLGALLADEHGPKNLMIVGLLLQAIIGFGIGAIHGAIANHITVYATGYGVFLSLGEFGPGNCIGVLAAKTVPLVVSEQFYNSAAIIGKVGAFIGIWGMYYTRIALIDLLRLTSNGCSLSTNH
ncbi:hypothetical protein EDD17DRAFT_1753851 [Pisolithus thermaeus]|nr:hypothetical protein EV401DRAFT_2064910 [Pisolithus croceorrhizus]KAI6165656.1 hypothetical protein EDD17DRAFT_1753851 [Pisolithus thermaeus]